MRGGYTVSAKEVETVLLNHPQVLEAAVVGESDPDLGEEIVAYVVTSPTAALTEDEVIGYCKERLAAFKYPRHIIFLDTLPKSSTGKILKSALSRRNNRNRRDAEDAGS